MVLIGNRRPEQRHEAVAKELIDGALVAVHLRERELEELAENIVHCLRAQARGERRGVGNVTEKHCDQLTLALASEAGCQHLAFEMGGRVVLCPILRGVDGRLAGQRSAALATELWGVGIFMCAGGATNHRRPIRFQKPAQRYRLLASRSNPARAKAGLLQVTCCAPAVGLLNVRGCRRCGARMSASGPKRALRGRL